MGTQHQDNSYLSQVTITVGLSLLFLISLVTVGCKQEGTSEVEKQVGIDGPLPADPFPPCQHAIVKIALLQDKSGSVGHTRTPQVTMEHLDLLVNFIRPCGGEIGFGTINEQSNSSLYRLRIEAPPADAPKEPNKNGNPFQVQQDMKEYRKARVRYDQSMKVFDSEMERRIAAFKLNINARLDAPATARRSDFFGGIQRANLFLSENTAAWPSSPRQYLVIVGDGIDNVKSEHESLPKTIQLILVNGSAAMGSLASFNPSRFESIESAIDFVVASGKGDAPPK